MKNVKLSKTSDQRTLNDLVSVGAATLKDFEILRIKTVNALLKKEARQLYLQLCKTTGKQHDICVEDVFSAAIAQARDPRLSLKKCQWWYWSAIRKKNNDSNK